MWFGIWYEVVWGVSTDPLQGTTLASDRKLHLCIFYEILQTFLGSLMVLRSEFEAVTVLWASHLDCNWG